jgi:putative restriction endonuclease
MRMVAGYLARMPAIERLDQLLRPDLADAIAQWRSIQSRGAPEPGVRQPDFTALEVVLSHGASLLVDHRRYGSTTTHMAEEPVQLLAALFRRPASSVLAKMANLDGSRPHGAKFDHAAGLAWSADRHRFDRSYAVVLLAARRSGIDDSLLPDFLAPDWRSGAPSASAPNRLPPPHPPARA